MTRALSGGLAGFGLAGVIALSSCVAEGQPGDTETVGQEGKVVFGAETVLAFRERVAVGSKFAVTKRAVDDEDESAVAAAVLESSDADVVAVDGLDVTITGPGSADLSVKGDDGEIDRITLRAAKAGATTLASGPLLAVTDTVDARLPDRFAVRIDEDTSFLVASVDKCGGDLLDLHASTLEASGAVPVAVDDTQPSTFTLKTQVRGDAVLTLKTPGLEDLVYNVKSVDNGDVDEVQAALTSAEGVTATLLGRAFIDDVELIADLQFSWTADPRVTLEATTGMVTRANVAFPAEGEPPDDRPAAVTAEVFGESGSVDLLTVTSTTNTLGTPARELVIEDDTSTGAGCQGGTACDPEAALLGLLGLRGLRRLRRLPRA